MSARIWLFILNAIVLLGLAIYAFSTVRRHPTEKAPENLEPFLADEDLEGRRLERVLGWALLFAAVVAVALPLYWLHEPSRQRESKDYFSNGSVERGEVLFSNSAMPKYNAAMSLQCANCHGATGGGGPVSTTYDPDGDGPAKAIQVTWQAPALNTELLRFSPGEVNTIITYGRPGTPMQAWGVKGGGPKNTQAINDLVAFIKSIQLTPQKAQAEAAANLKKARTAAQDQLTAATKSLATAKKAVTTAEDAYQKAQADSKTSAYDLAQAKQAVTYAKSVVTEDEQALAWAKAWAKYRANVTDGQLLFELNCARCHTKGWSVFDPTLVNGTEILGPAGGGGQGGAPNLRDGDTVRRFGPGGKGSVNFKAHATFVTMGSDFEVQYGIGGIGSGRMPGFGKMLTKQMIDDIVEYERTGIQATTWNVPFGNTSSNNQSGTGTVSTTTTTLPALGGG